MFEQKHEIEEIRRKIINEEPVSRSNEHFNELNLVQVQNKLLENEAKRRISRNNVKFLQAENSYNDANKGVINAISHKKELTEVKKSLDKNREFLKTVKNISDNDLLASFKEEDYKKICSEYTDCFAIERIINDVNSIDKHENDVEKNVLKGIMKDQEFVNMIKEANDAGKSIISTVRDKEKVDKDNLTAELEKITSKHNPLNDRTFSIKDYKDDVNSYVYNTDFYNYQLEESYKYTDKREVNLNPAVSLAEKASEAAKRNLSHKTIKTLDKSVDMVAKLEVIHNLKTHLVAINTKEQRMGKYDFTEAHKKIKETVDKLNKYEKELQQQLDKANYHEIDMDKEENVMESQWRREMREDANKTVEKPSNEITNDVQKEQSTPAPSSTNNELDDMFAEDRLSDLPKGMTPEMVAVASDILFRNGMVESNDINNLSSKDMDRSIDYAEKIQTFKGMSESQIAEEMAKDPWIDENGRYHEKGEITPMDVMAQQNINRTHNVYNKINNAYGFTDEQNMTM